MYVLFARVVLKDRLEHIPRAGDFLRAFIADVAQARADEPRLEPFVVAALHIPQHERREEILPPEREERGRVHAAGGDQDQAARRAGVFLRVDLRVHAAVARADKDWLFDAQPVKKRAQTGRKRLIGAQRLRIVEQQHLTFYNYFDDKYDLLNYCWLALAEKIRLSEYHHAPENEMLYLFFDRIYAFTKQNNELISRVLSHNPEAGYMFSRFRNFLSSQMRRIFGSVRMRCTRIFRMNCLPTITAIRCSLCGSGQR